MPLSAFGFAVLVWGSLALVAAIFVYELVVVWRERKERTGRVP